ncbi:MAG TPA: hypothetical protein VII43_02930 [Opitutaceae bacterium]
MSAAPQDPASLQAELDAVKLREASFRAKMVQEFLDRGERNTYLHTLRAERAALVKRVQEASGDIEVLTRMLEAESEKAAAAQEQLQGIIRSRAWGWAGPLRSLERWLHPAAAQAVVKSAGANPPAEGAPFTYYLHTSPFRIYRGESFTLRGWAWPADGRAVTQVRANLSGRLFTGTVGIEEPEVIARYGAQPRNPRPGFEVTFETPPGRHLLCLEAQLDSCEWRSIMSTSIWCEAASR